jgi:hypothetical protein
MSRRSTARGVVRTRRFMKQNAVAPVHRLICASPTPLSPCWGATPTHSGAWLYHLPATGNKHHAPPTSSTSASADGKAIGCSPAVCLQHGWARGASKAAPAAREREGGVIGLDDQDAASDLPRPSKEWGATEIGVGLLECQGKHII